MLQFLSFLYGTLFIFYVSVLLLRFAARMPFRLDRAHRRLFRKRTTILSFRSLDLIPRDEFQEWLMKEGYVKEMIWESEATKG